MRLQPINGGEITVIPDSSGSFVFNSLSPGRYTVVVNAGDEYQVARESVFIDTDLNLSRRGARSPTTARRETVMIHLQPKNAATAKAGVSTALAEVPEKARKLFEKDWNTRARAMLPRPWIA